MELRRDGKGWQIRQLQSQNRELDGDIAYIGNVIIEAKKIIDVE